MQTSEHQLTIGEAPIPLGDLVIDLDGHLITYPDGRDTTLTLRECEVLRVLIHSRGRVLSYAALGLEAWHYPDSYYSPQGIRNCIWQLRQKLGSAAVAIETVRSDGYRFRRLTSGSSDVLCERSQV